MRVIRTWQLLIKRSWKRMFAFVFLIFCTILFYPSGRTPAEQTAARRGYLSGLLARLGDSVLWERALVACAGFAILLAVFSLLAYYFSSFAHSVKEKRAQK